MNIGGNSNQQENIINSNNAEQLLDEKLDNRDMTFRCEVLKKVIKSEDQDG